MARFVVNRPITTTEPFIKVDGGLPEGRYKFQLVVVDGQGNKSQPATLMVTIKGRTIIRNP